MAVKARGGSSELARSAHRPASGLPAPADSSGASRSQTRAVVSRAPETNRPGWPASFRTMRPVAASRKVTPSTASRGWPSAAFGYRGEEQDPPRAGQPPPEQAPGRRLADRDVFPAGQPADLLGLVPADGAQPGDRTRRERVTEAVNTPGPRPGWPSARDADRQHQDHAPRTCAHRRPSSVESLP